MTKENFIEVGETYKSHAGVEWKCVSINGDSAWLMSHRHKGVAYEFKLSGESVRFGSHYTILPNPPKEPMQPPWDVLPEWVEWCAMDDDGDIYAFECEPSLSGYCFKWVSGEIDNITNLRFPRGNAPWNKSLVRKPNNGGN